MLAYNRVFVENYVCKLIDAKKEHLITMVGEMLGKVCTDLATYDLNDAEAAFVCEQSGVAKSLQKMMNPDAILGVFSKGDDDCDWTKTLTEANSTSPTIRLIVQAIQAATAVFQDRPR